MENDIYDLIMGSGPSAQQSAQAMANAIRGNRSGQTLYALGAQDVPGALQQVMGQHAAQDQGILEKSLATRARYGQEAQRFKESLAQQQAQHKESMELEKARMAMMAKMYSADARLAAVGRGKPLASKDVDNLRTYDAAEERLDAMEKLYKANIGTYPGAGLVHSMAALVPGAQDPRFAQLKSLVKSHLFKGLKADIGGRITNFEIQYGKDMFPTETDRPEIALEKLKMIRSTLNNDKGNLIRYYKETGRDIGEIEQHASPPPIYTGGPQKGANLTPRDIEAIEWAKSHPDDPDAQKILQHHNGGW